jgi:hypothetical protein
MEANMKRAKQLRVITFALLAMCLQRHVALGQTTTGSIVGTVKDAQAAVIPGASVVVTNMATHADRKVTTDSGGSFVIQFLPPGVYQATISKVGFSAVTTKAVHLEISQTVSLNTTLQVGSANQSINVNADAELINVASAGMGTVIGEKQVHELPLNGRNFTQLLTLTPGATPISTSQGAIQGTNAGSTVALPGSAFSNPAINGQQNRESLYLLDGVVNTDFRTTTYSILPIIDSIDEFKVQSHNDDPAFGSVMGGVINLITKSGTNTLHGSGWEFLRNNAFDARNPFTDINLATGAAIPPAEFHQNEFGMTAGGPLWLPKLYNGTNKTFFFFGYEGWRYNTPINTFEVVPTAAELNGDFSNAQFASNAIFDPTTTATNGSGYTRQAFKNSIIPPSQINAQMQNYLSTYFDKPNLSGNASYNALVTGKTVNNNDSYQGRVDQKIGVHDTLFFRYSQMNSALSVPLSNTITELTSFAGKNYAFGLTHIFGPNLVLNVNGGHSNRPFVSYTNKTDGLLNVSLASPYGSAGLLQPDPSNGVAWSIGSTLSWHKGRHDFSFGETYTGQSWGLALSEYVIGFANTQTEDPANPGTTGNSLASALLGYANSGLLVNNRNYTYHDPSYAVFAGDSWRVTPKLTMNLGLRYDRANLFSLDNLVNNGFNFETGNWELGGGKLPASCAVSGKAPCIPGTSTDAATNLASITGNDGSIAGSHIIVSPVASRSIQPDNANWGPRLGLAYQVHEGTVISAGFGIVYDTLAALGQTYSNPIGSWPQVAIASPSYNELGRPLEGISQVLTNASNPITTGGPFQDGGYFYNPKIKPSYSQQWNLQIERVLTKSLVGTIGYVGSTTNRLDYGGQANGAVTPGAGTFAQVNARRPFPYMTAFNYSNYIANANYNSFQAKLTKRYTSGLQFLTSYTWSKAIDAGSSGHFGAENGPGGGAAIQNYYNMASNRSVSSYDVTHFLSVSGQYDLPVGHGKRYLANGSWGQILGNWQLNTVAQLRSGQPYTLNVDGDVANVGLASGGYERPNRVGDPNVSHPTKTKWFNTAAFAAPVLSYGNVGRNSLRSSSYYSADISLFKMFPIKDVATITFRAEVFNAFNIINYGTPGLDLSSPSNFGVVSSMVGTPRQIQLGVRGTF